VCCIAGTVVLGLLKLAAFPQMPLSLVLAPVWVPLAGVALITLAFTVLACVYAVQWRPSDDEPDEEETCSCQGS
jgi:hypothetical protein